MPRDPKRERAIRKRLAELAQASDVKKFPRIMNATPILPGSPPHLRVWKRMLASIREHMRRKK